MSSPNIVAYLKPDCGWSRGVRAVFQKYGLEFEDRDVVNNLSNYEEMVRKTGQNLQPCVAIDENILADVSGDEVEQYLLEKGYVKPSSAATDVPTDRACDDHSQPISIGEIEK